MRKYKQPKSALFSREKGVVLSRLQVSDEAYYSITRPRFANHMQQILTQHLKEVLNKTPAQCTITDATACVGGDTIHFSKYFNHVNSVEINPDHCAMLNNNINEYHRKNVTVHCGDYVKLYSQLNQDIVYIDPPWGGPSYKHQKSVWLALSGTPLPQIVQSVSKHASIIVVKVPVNFGVSKLLRKGTMPQYNSLHVYHMTKMNIVVIVPKTTTKKRTRKLL